tara:strand:- start:1774 stop:2070 length:297 start_codon:yes stop_codon:yes gene_type:complete
MIFGNSYIIPHGNLTPDQGFIFFFGLVLFSLVVYGIYLTFGSGKNELRDSIDEHAKMHELGIAHGHGGNKDAYEMSGKFENNVENSTHLHNDDQSSST